jgi:hypothetical protein
VVKPTLVHGFDYKKMQWADQLIEFGLPEAPETLAPAEAAPLAA